MGRTKLGAEVGYDQPRGIGLTEKASLRPEGEERRPAPGKDRLCAWRAVGLIKAEHRAARCGIAEPCCLPIGMPQAPWRVGTAWDPRGCRAKM